MRSMIAVILILFSSRASLSAQEIRVENTAKYIGDGQYSWTVYVTGDLQRVRSVKYTLHPTFPEPVVWGKRANFAFSAVGWGEFNIVATIFYKDAVRKPTTVNHWLRLFSPGKAKQR